MGNLTKNFSKREFDCRCGCDMPEDVYNNVKSLAIELQIIRDFTNESISINSGYRCLKHNRDIGSNDRSQHPKGKAADIVIDGYNPDEVVMSTQAELAFYKEGREITESLLYPTGALVQNKDNGGVFFVEDGIKYPIMSKEILNFKTMGNSSRKVKRLAIKLVTSLK